MKTHIRKTSITNLSILLVALYASMNPLKAQTTLPQTRLEPAWWFGISGAGNVDLYRGSTQNLNSEVYTPTSFEHGAGIGGYGSILAEYRPDPVWGLMLNVAFDNRYGIMYYGNDPSTFTTPANLNLKISYIAIEPSLRIAPCGGGFYMFLGPTANYTVQKSFMFRQMSEPPSNTEGDLSHVNNWVFSGQVGVGYDIPLSSPGNPTQVELSPFVSYLPYYFPYQIRSVDNLTLNTIRVGVALKFGHTQPAPPPIEQTVAPTPPEPSIAFSAQPPACIPMQRMIKETLPIRNYIFFDKGSNQIPSRYVTLTYTTAMNFKEEQMQNTQSGDSTARSSRQLAVYHNVLNILGDRMRKNPNVSITLTGSSGGEGAENGRVLAEAVKTYLVDNFDIDDSRITTVGRNRPYISSREDNTTQQFDLVDAEDRRVEITSKSPDLLMEYGDTSGMLMPTMMTTSNEDMPDTHVFFSAPGASESLTSWSIAITDEHGNTENYGPYTGESTDISGRMIQGKNIGGNYKVVFTGTTKSGKTVTHESNINLTCKQEPSPNGTKYSILFEFDKSKTSKTYSGFLTQVVAASIPDNSTVILEGHTDIVGEEQHNMDLSESRAEEAEGILQTAVKDEGKQNVNFKLLWYGDDTAHAPFGNTLPEERFYNRTVVIDIIPASQQPVANQ